MTVLISNLVGYASYDVTVTYYDGSGCSATTTQTVGIPADTPGGSGGGGGGGSPPQQEESSFTGTHPTSDAAASTSTLIMNLSAYSNPASDVLLVPVAAQAAGGTVHLLDQLGHIVRQLPVGTSTSLNLDTRELSDGLYYLLMPGAPAKGQAIQIRH